MPKRVARSVVNLRRQVRNFIGDSGGNIALTFAIVLAMLIGAVGVSLDYARAYNYRNKMQSDLDAALLAVVKDVGTSSNTVVETQLRNWFAAQTDAASLGYVIDGVTINAADHNISANARMSVPTTLLRITGINTINVDVTSSVAGVTGAFINVYIVLDKSASMLLAATQADQDKMRAKSGCAFACHEPEGTYTYNGKKYYNNYDLSRAMGITLRSDVALSAINEVLTLVDYYDPKNVRIKTGLYTLGKTATQVLAPTYSTSTVRSTLTDDSKNMTSETSEVATYFDLSLDALKTLVGAAGDGKTAGSPLKLVLLLTDGVQSERNWVVQTRTGVRFPPSPSSIPTLQKNVTPPNPDWCSQIKNLKASFGVLYTEYVPMTWDWGYRATVGQTMATSYFKGVWKGTYGSKYDDTIRRDYIPVALSACASNSSLYLSASSVSEINAGLAKIFKTYLEKVRVTK